MKKQITIKGTISTEKISENSPNQECFWDCIKGYTNNEELKSFNRTKFENRLKSEFGRNLKEQMNTYFLNDWYGGGLPTQVNLETKSLSGFFFEVSFDTITVNSNLEKKHPEIEFILNIVGFEKLIELFSKDVELFETVLRSYVSSAFRETMAIVSGFIDWDFPNLEEKINELITQKKGAYPKQTNEYSVNKKKWWEWKWETTICNTSLVLFFFSSILGFLVAYVWDLSLSSKVEKIQEELNSIKKEELKFQKDFLDKQKKEVDKDKDRLNDLTKRWWERSLPSPKPSGLSS